MDAPAPTPVSNGAPPGPAALESAPPRLSAALVRAGRAGTPPALLDLPERVAQFGTGALLRGLADALFDEGNRGGGFDGRVVMIGSTGSGRADALGAQDGLFTLTEQGLEEGCEVERTRVVASVSRALAADDAWDDVLALAASPDLRLVVSNTTEIGIRMDDADSVRARPPRSFPAKLTAFLHARARTFDFDPSAGLVMLPCELIDDNGDALRALVLVWAEREGLGERFAAWVREACAFANTLVDRIVPGAPGEAEREALEARLGFRDALATVTEPYRLWAVEGDAALERRIGLRADGFVVTPSVTPYRLRKVHLLNGTHTLVVPVALGAGCATVEEAMRDPLVGAYATRVMDEEIVPAVEAELDAEGVAPGTAARFARDVRDRFANPFIRHELTAITLQQTMKMAVRVVPVARRYAALHGAPPPLLALGFAAFLLLQRAAAGLPTPGLAGHGLLDDDGAEALRAYWRASAAGTPAALRALVHRVCADTSLWDDDLTVIAGFEEAVAEHLGRALGGGIPSALRHALGAPVPA